MRKQMLAAPVLIAALAGWAVVVTTQDEVGPDGLVTEEVEPGVERIIRDDAGHDLDETHPTNRYDMDDVHAMPDGSVLLESTYNGSDNDANPPGALVWVLGEPGTARLPADFFCGIGDPAMLGRPGGDNIGMFCIDESGEASTYLAGTPINAVTVAPDGTVWAVGGGDLYRITRD